MTEMKLIALPTKLFTQDVWHLNNEPLKGHDHVYQKVILNTQSHEHKKLFS